MGQLSMLPSELPLHKQVPRLASLRLPQHLCRAASSLLLPVLREQVTSPLCLGDSNRFQAVQMSWGQPGQGSVQPGPAALITGAARRSSKPCCAALRCFGSSQLRRNHSGSWCRASQRSREGRGCRCWAAQSHHGPPWLARGSVALPAEGAACSNEAGGAACTPVRATKQLMQAAACRR